VPLAVERALVDAGHDVETARTLMPGSRDEQVLAVAVQLDRILLTFDRDFGGLIFRMIIRPAPTTIYVRSTLAPHEHATQILKTLEYIEPGFFLVVDGNKIRKRLIR
jgi:predicted nuclease of predicted toxin-antitoxin system